MQLGFISSNFLFSIEFISNSTTNGVL